MEKEEMTQQNTTETPVSDFEAHFIAGPNTRKIKNNIIDFDRVASIDKIEGEYNGMTTYGIKFTFDGKKHSSRIAWYTRNVKQRDEEYEEFLNFWSELPLTLAKIEI